MASGQFKHRLSAYRRTTAVVDEDRMNTTRWNGDAGRKSRAPRWNDGGSGLGPSDSVVERRRRTSSGPDGFDEARWNRPRQVDVSGQAKSDGQTESKIAKSLACLLRSGKRDFIGEFENFASPSPTSLNSLKEKMEDEMDSFAILRKFVNSTQKSKKSTDGSMDETETTAIDEALRILQLKNEFNVHLRFLASHVLWQSILARNETDRLRMITHYEQSLPQNSISILRRLLRTSESPINVRIESPLSTASLSIFNGYINVSTTKCSTSLLDFIVPTILRSIQQRRTQILDPYQHLFVLKNALEKSTSRIRAKESSISTSRLSELAREIETVVVRPYWDSRFAGCTESAIGCFRAILNGMENGAIDSEAMINRYSDNDRYPWYLRGKYKLLAILVEHCGLEQLLRCESQLLVKLGNGLAATHVAPFSSAVYKTVLNVFAQKYKNRTDLVVEPLRKWTLTVVDYLLSDNRLLAMHASKYWVPSIAKFVPDGCRWILEDLAKKRDELKRFDGGRYLLDSFIIDSLCGLDLGSSSTNSSTANRPTDEAWIIWASMLIRLHARKWLREVPPMDDKDWSIGLRHLEDDVRLESITLLLDVSTKYVPLAPSQYRIAADFIRNNLIVASSSFRRRLLAAYGKWIRASAEYFSKQTVKKQDESIDQFREFVVKSILERVFDNLIPGANFQRMSTAMGIMQLTLDTVSSHESLWSFLEIEQRIVGKRDFGLQVLRSLQNSSEEIRRRGSYLLKTFFRFPFQPSAFDLETVMDLCTSASTLSRSPKAIDCDTACVIWEVIAEMLLMKNQHAIALNTNGSIEISPTHDSDTSSIHAFFADQLRMMQFDFAQLQNDLRPAAENHPLHGWAQMAAAILELIRNKGVDESKSLPLEIRSGTLELACRVIDFMLSALGSPAEGLCPSLAEMQGAIVSSSSSATANGFADELENETEMEDAAIPLDEQLVLACCWLNIKAFAFVLSELAAHSLSVDPDPYPVVHRVGLALFDAMSRTRHFGALEGCNLAFGKYLRLCMASGNVQINEIPMKLLDKVLEHVSTPRHVSLTRRAVGFSIMIECIAAAGCSMKQKRYLEYAFDRLLSIAESGLDHQLNDQDEKSDVNVVRAMHCLRLLLRSSSLDLDVLPYVSQCYRLAVHQFSNPVWSIRNSAMLILSSILWRLFGRREVKQDDDQTTHSENRMDLIEFYADFPEMWEFFGAQLAKIVDEGRVNVDSRIFALLSFAQNLIVTDLNGNETLLRELNAAIGRLVELLFRTPDTRLKRVVAEILANFVPKLGDKRRVFFETIREYVAKRSEGGQLPMNDRLGLVHLINALKLKVDVKTAAEETIEVPVTDEDPVAICRYLRKCLSAESRPAIDSEQLLIRLADGSGGLSAQCLALPLLARLYFQMHSDGNDFYNDGELERKRFLSLSERILRMVDEHQNENRRLAAACGYFYLVPSMMAMIQKDKSMDEEMTMANSRLLLALSSLLSDEDELVRYTAAKATMTHGDESLSPILCSKKLFDACCSSTPRRTRTSEIIVGKQFGMDEVERKRDREKLLSIAKKADSFDGDGGGGEFKEKTFLFAQQDFNIYKEDSFHLRICFQSLSGRSGDDEEANGNWSTEATVEDDEDEEEELARLCVLALEKMKGNAHLRRRNEESVFVIGLRLLLRRRLLDLTHHGHSAATRPNEIFYSLRVKMVEIFGAAAFL